jgi:hypothetical protein
MVGNHALETGIYRPRPLALDVLRVRTEFQGLKRVDAPIECCDRNLKCGKPRLPVTLAAPTAGPRTLILATAHSLSSLCNPPASILVQAGLESGIGSATFAKALRIPA